MNEVVVRNALVVDCDASDCPRFRRGARFWLDQMRIGRQHTSKSKEPVEVDATGILAVELT